MRLIYSQRVPYYNNKHAMDENKPNTSYSTSSSNINNDKNSEEESLRAQLAAAYAELGRERSMRQNHNKKNLSCDEDDDEEEDRSLEALERIEKELKVRLN